MNKLLRFAIAAIMTLTSSAALAQAETPIGSTSEVRAYFDQNIRGFGSEPHLVIDGRIYEPNQWIMNYPVREAFSENGLANSYAHLHLTHARRAAWGLWGSVIGYLILSAAVGHDESEAQIALLLGLTGGMVYTGYQASLSNAYLLRAINLYNGVEPLSMKTDPLASRLSMPKGLALRFSF